MEIFEGVAYETDRITIAIIRALAVLHGGTAVARQNWGEIGKWVLGFSPQTNFVLLSGSEPLCKIS